MAWNKSKFAATRTAGQEVSCRFAPHVTSRCHGFTPAFKGKRCHAGLLHTSRHGVMGSLQHSKERVGALRRKKDKRQRILLY